MHNKSQLGLYGQQVVEHYLCAQQFAIVHRNFRRFEGEVDLIARKGSLLIFVEVKTRNGSQMIDPTEVITRSKQRKIAHAAAHFLHQMNTDNEYDCRFDVAIVSCQTAKPTVSYIPDAFQAEEYA